MMMSLKNNWDTAVLMGYGKKLKCDMGSFHVSGRQWRKRKHTPACKRMREVLNILLSITLNKLLLELNYVEHRKRNRPCGKDSGSRIQIYFILDPGFSILDPYTKPVHLLKSLKIVCFFYSIMNNKSWSVLCTQ